MEREHPKMSCHAISTMRATSLLPWPLLALGLCLAVAFPKVAYAAWPVQGQSQVLLGFHESYSADGRQIAHSGADLAGSAGACVLAPASGTVTFVGDVPASDDSSEKTMLAVSIRIDDGRIVSLMPLESAAVQEGDAVSEGDAIGILAASGDRSVSQPHLHIGLRDGATYKDPLELLGYEETPADESDASQQERVAAGAFSEAAAGGSADAEAAAQEDSASATPLEADATSAESGQAPSVLDEQCKPSATESACPQSLPDQAPSALVTSGGATLEHEPANARLAGAGSQAGNIAGFDFDAFQRAASGGFSALQSACSEGVACFQSMLDKGPSAMTAIIIAAIALLASALAMFVFRRKIRAIAGKRRTVARASVKQPATDGFGRNPSAKGSETGGRGAQANAELVMAAGR